MKAHIIEKKEIAQGTLQVKFSIEEPFEFKPGQHTFVTLPNLLYPDERGNRRHFSIVNSPDEKGIITIATRVRESGFKKTLKELENGSQVEVGPIAGGFVLPEDASRPLVFIAGGIGITPFMSMLRFVQNHSRPHVITLIYSNRDRQSSAFLDELEQIAKQNQNIKVIATMTQDPSWAGKTGRIDAQFIKKHIEDLNRPEYFVVGPTAMTDAIVGALSEAGVENENIRRENFSGY